MAIVTAAARNVGGARVSSESVPMPSSGILWAYRSFAWSGVFFSNHHSAFVILFYYLIFTVAIQSEVNYKTTDSSDIGISKASSEQNPPTVQAGMKWHQPNSFCSVQESTTRVKRQPREWRKHCLSVVHRRLIFNSGKSNKMANK